MFGVDQESICFARGENCPERSNCRTNEFFADICAGIIRQQITGGLPGETFVLDSNEAWYGENGARLELSDELPGMQLIRDENGRQQIMCTELGCDGYIQL